jgi:hypothetical protein
MLDFPIDQFQSVSPTGKWAAVLAVIDGRVSTAILGLAGDTFRWVRGGYWMTRWSHDGQYFYLDAQGSFASAPGGTLVIALDGAAPPHIPSSAPTTAADILPHETNGVAPGPDPDTYAFSRAEWLRNIYRIPLHR